MNNKITFGLALALLATPVLDAATTSRAAVKLFFQTGDVPTEAQFSTTWDSTAFIQENETITGNWTFSGTFDTSGVTAIGNNSATVAINSSDWDIDATGIATGLGNVTSDGTIEGATLTEGGVAVHNNDEMDASSELAAIIDDETGTGAIVFGTDPVLTGTLAIGDGTTAAGVIQIDEDDDAGANFASFTLPAAGIAANTAYTLPPAIGAAGSALTDAAGDGILSWSIPGGAGDMTKAVYDADTNNYVDVSETIVIEVNNDTGVQIDDGKVVYISGFDIPSDLPEIILADSDAAATMPAVGIVNGDIANGADGTVIISGIWEGDTTAFNQLDVLYVSGTAGAMTTTKPTGTALIQKIGIVARDHITAGQIVITGAGRSNDVPNFVGDDAVFSFGSDADWDAFYDATGEQLEFSTTAFNGSADAVGMFRIRVNDGAGTIDADQTVFEIIDNATDLFSVDAEGDATLAGDLGVTNVTATSLLWNEKAANGTPGAGKGEVWVKNTVPSTLFFTDDANTDFGVATLVGAQAFAGAIDAPSFTADAGSGIDTQAAGALDIGNTTATSIDYGSASVTAHTFTTDGTGTAEVVLPAGSIDSTEILDGTVAAADIAADVAHGAEATVASATTTDLGAETSDKVSITGTTTITGFGTVAAGTKREGRFTGILTLTHNATSLILPGAANITTAAGDRFEAYSLGSGNWVVSDYTKADGTAVVSSGGGGGYVLTAVSGAGNNLADATDYFWSGIVGNGISGVEADNQIVIPATGTMERLDITVRYNSGTNETVNFYIRHDDGSPADVGNVTTTLDAGLRNISNASVSTAVTEGDKIAFKITTPTWATDPTSIRLYATVYISLP